MNVVPVRVGDGALFAMEALVDRQNDPSLDIDFHNQFGSNQCSSSQTKWQIGIMDRLKVFWLPEVDNNQGNGYMYPMVHCRENT
jgi:hypothetical protein